MATNTVVPIDTEWLLGVNGAVTVTGILVDYNGDLVYTTHGTPAPSFTYTIPVANGSNTPVTWAQVAGLSPGSLVATFPNVRGVRVNLSGDLYAWNQNTTTAPTDFQTNYTRARLVKAKVDGNAFGILTDEDKAFYAGSSGSSGGSSYSSPLSVSSGTPALQSINGASSVGVGTAFNLTQTRKDWTLGLVVGGTAGAFSAQLEGSLDGSNWSIIGAPITAFVTANYNFQNAPYIYVRANVTVLSGGSSPTVTANIAGV